MALPNGQTGNATEQQFLPSLQVYSSALPNGGDLGVFDQFAGGDVTATPAKYRPGGMGPEITYLALPVYADVTLTRVYDEGRDQALIATMHTLVGNTYATVTLQPLDQNGNPWGIPRTYYGRIASVKDGNADSTSSSVRKWDIMISVENESN